MEKDMLKNQELYCRKQDVYENIYGIKYFYNYYRKCWYKKKLYTKFPEPTWNLIK